MTTLHLTVLRHGRSRADDENVHECRYDSPLNPGGEAQAAALAAYWQAHPPGFDRAYCSTLQRAHGTARIVTDALGVALTPTESWLQARGRSLAFLAASSAPDPDAALFHPHREGAGGGSRPQRQAPCPALLRRAAGSSVSPLCKPGRMESAH